MKNLCMNRTNIFTEWSDEEKLNRPDKENCDYQRRRS